MSKISKPHMKAKLEVVNYDTVLKSALDHAPEWSSFHITIDINQIVESSGKTNEQKVELKRSIHKKLYKLSKQTNLIVNGKAYDYYDYRIKAIKESDFDYILKAETYVKTNGELAYYKLNDIFNQFVIKTIVTKTDIYVRNVYGELEKVKKSFDESNELIYNDNYFTKYKRSKEVLVYVMGFTDEQFKKLYEYLQSKVGLNIILFRKGSTKATRVATFSRMYDTPFFRTLDVEISSNREFIYHKDLNMKRANFTINGEDKLLYKFFNIELKQFETDLNKIYKFYKNNTDLVNKDLSSRDYEIIKHKLNQNKIYDFDEVIDSLLKELEEKSNYREIGLSELIKQEEDLY